MSMLYAVDYNLEISSIRSDALRSVEYYGNEVQALNRVAGAGCCILLVHYKILENKTPEYIALLKEANSEMIVIVIGHELDTDGIIDCVLSGASGYQNIDTLGQYIERLIKAVMAGEVWISRKVVAKLIERWRAELVA